MPTLAGRDAEIELIGRFLTAAARDGDTLMLTGEPGIGKTALLELAAQNAAAARMRVVRVAGVEFEAQLSFAGLNQLLQGVRLDASGLDPAYRAALRVVLGLGDASGPGRLLLSNAVLALLQAQTGEQPLILIIDDLQWIDRASVDVLTFVARRTRGSRIGFLGAIRSGDRDPDDLGLPHHVLPPLSDAAAGDLLASLFPTLAPAARARLLAEAQGNPLALREFPVSLSGPQRAAVESLPTLLPLTDRLRRIFTSRVNALPGPARRLLLLLALDGRGDLLQLASVLNLDRALTDLVAAEQARLIAVDDGYRVEFAHPLIGSTVVELSTGDQRRAAHRSLAAGLENQPERQAWHLADATLEPDESIAVLLDGAARRHVRQGDTPGAVRALTRAAALSPGAAARGRRLGEAAYLGAHGGQLDIAPDLMAAARASDPHLRGSLREASTAAYLLMNGDGDVATAHRLLVASIDDYRDPGDSTDEVLVHALHTLFFVCILGARPELWESLHIAVARLAPSIPLTLALGDRVFADPARVTAEDLARLDAAIRDLDDETNAIVVNRVSLTAMFVDRLADCRRATQRVRHQIGGEGSGIEANALSNLAVDYFMSGRWSEAGEVAERGLRLANAHGPGLTAWSFIGVLAQLAAIRGDVSGARARTDDLINWAQPRGIRVAYQLAKHARGLAALGQGEFDEAYLHLAAISPAGILASHVGRALFAAWDLVEAAVHSGRHEQARAHGAALRDANVAAVSPRLAMVVAACTALTAASPDAATDEFELALKQPGIDRWPFDTARVRLAYGEHLRRVGAVARARAQLAAALDTFDRLGAVPWATRTAGELRATGHRRMTGRAGPVRALSPQELEIASLAASGLTNKQIGERLFLSPRTVGNHLHRIFPKLEITSRAGLRDALSRLG